MTIFSRKIIVNWEEEEEEEAKVNNKKVEWKSTYGKSLSIVAFHWKVTLQGGKAKCWPVVTAPRSKGLLVKTSTKLRSKIMKKMCYNVTTLLLVNRMKVSISKAIWQLAPSNKRPLLIVISANLWVTIQLYNI